jgi:hypothetical protein
MAFRIAEPTDCPIVTSVQHRFRPQTTFPGTIVSNVGLGNERVQRIRRDGIDAVRAHAPHYPTHWMSAIAAEGLFGSHAKIRSACAICTRRGPSQWLTVRR